ncbi:MAG: phosphoglycerate dehydrogenase [Chitinispirillaceae bacterium]|nr:phosphoglycerate dehydrogenase [Chitinispirillaceae bacterium]
MYKIQTLNKISPVGINLVLQNGYEVASEILNPDAILVRSTAMHDMQLPESVKAIARAGAGVNNIPVEACANSGVVVFNTPGANANGVKELVLAGMLLASRNIIPGVQWAQTLIGKGDEVPKLIEKGKSNFAGPEIKGKRLGVIGLGAIGVMVANDAVALGMQVTGYDPYISVEAAWGLSSIVKRARSLESLLAESDYLTMHLPLNDKTKGMINQERLALMKKGVCILNFSRGGLVRNADLFQAMTDGTVGTYVTDFPDEDLLKHEKVIAIPHLGASTPEAEDNCAVMAVNQVRNYLEYGNIKNSVNFPDCDLGIPSGHRIIIANRNVPNMVGQITTLLAAEKINIADMLNRHRGDFAFNIIDIDGTVDKSIVGKISAIEGVIMVRHIVADGK